MRASLRAAAGIAAGAALALTASVAASAAELQEVESPGASKFQDAPFKDNTVDIFLSPKDSPTRGDKLEYMVRMKAGDVLTYSLIAPQADAFWHELHGHTEGKVTFYKKAEGAAHHGSVVAPFDGLHGWYLENRTESPVIVRIRLGGFYELIPPGEEGNEIGAEPGLPPFAQ